MDYPSYGSRDSLHSRPAIQRNRRTWTNNNGAHFVVETAYSTPDMLFEDNEGTFGRPSPRAERSQGSGVFGTAFSLLGEVLGDRQRTGQGNTRRASREPYVEDMAYGEDHNDDAEDRSRRRPKGLIGKLAENILSGQQQRQRQTPSSRDRPREKRDGGGRRSSYAESRPRRDEGRRSSYNDRRSAYVDDVTDDEDDHTSEEYDSDDYEIPQSRGPRRAFTTNDASMVQALENAAEHHRREMRSCQARIASASKHSTLNTRSLQRLVDELKSHERAYENAKENLRMAKAGVGNSQSRRQMPRRGQSFREDQSTRAADATFDGFGGFFAPNRSAYTGFGDGPFGSFPGGFPHPLFNQLFNDMSFGRTSSFGWSFNSIPHATFTFTNGQSNARPGTSVHTGPQFQFPFGFAGQPAAPPRPPPNLLTPEEAKRLFQTYNERWAALAPTDPKILFPARGLKAGALSARDSIWAPTVSSTVATWSEETVMQANAQAFFLGVVGLSPQYTETPGTGKLAMGYNRAKASPTQVKELIDVLKKEKVRWHSDRLGRRNGGSSTGPNEALQRDERARAVFHAICELMDFAQGA